MSQDFLRQEDFWNRVQSEAIPETLEEQAAAYLGLIEGMKTAGLSPIEGLVLLELLIEHAPMGKEAGLGDMWNNFKNKVTGTVTGAVAGWKAPRTMNAIAGIAGGAGGGDPDRFAPWLETYQQQGIGGVARKAWDQFTAPDAVKKWAPYAISGLASMAGAKLMGASNAGALAAGVAGGYAGGRVMTNQPLVPQGVKNWADKQLDKAVGAQPAAPAGSAAPMSTGMQNTENHAAAQIQR